MTLITEMLNHTDEDVRQHGEKRTVQEHDGQEKDKGKASPISLDGESSRRARTH